MEYASQEYDELELLSRDGVLELNNRFSPSCFDLFCVYFLYFFPLNSITNRPIESDKNDHQNKIKRLHIDI